MTSYYLDLSDIRHIKSEKKNLNLILWSNIFKGWLISFYAARHCIDSLNNEMRWGEENALINKKGGRDGGKSL